MEHGIPTIAMFIILTFGCNWWKLYSDEKWPHHIPLEEVSAGTAGGEGRGGCSGLADVIKK